MTIRMRKRIARWLRLTGHRAAVLLDPDYRTCCTVNVAEFHQWLTDTTVSTDAFNKIREFKPIGPMRWDKGKAK